MTEPHHFLGANVNAATNTTTNAATNSSADNTADASLNAEEGNTADASLNAEQSTTAETQRAIRNSMVRLLARREHSAVELLHKLKQKEFEPADIKAVLQQFIEKNLQSDQRYAESFVRTAYDRGKGPSFIQQSLQQHDIDTELINTLLNDHAHDWYEAAFNVRQKRFGEALPSEWHDRQKQKRFLQYRGFYQQHIDEVFKP